jgi:hypothetical protein
LKHTLFYRLRSSHGVSSMLRFVFFSFFLGIQIVPLWTVKPVQAASADPDVPPGFYLVSSDYALNFYRRDYPSGSPDFVQVLDLSQGASLGLMHGPVSEVLPEKGQFGGVDARFESRSLQDYWRQAGQQSQTAYCVTNGSFFYMPEYPTRLPFSLKVDGEVVTEGFGGYGAQAYEGQRLMLEVWDDHADIRELTETSLYNSTAPNIIVGLTEEANKRAKKAVARTFVGLKDRDQNGKAETLYILNTSTAVQTEVAATLREFGAEKIMMLDGGGSTQLLCRDGWVIESERLIPQAIASYAGAPPTVSTQLLSESEWPVLITDQNFPLEIEIQNTGIVTWTEKDTRFLLEKSALSGEVRISLEGQVPPGESAKFTRSLAAYSQMGVYPVDLQWAIVHQGEIYPGQALTITSIVIPSALSDQIQEIEQQLDTWKNEPTDKIEARLNDWAQEQEDVIEPATIEPSTQTVDPGFQPGPLFSDILIIPLVMLPVVVIIAMAIANMQENRR